MRNGTRRRLGVPRWAPAVAGVGLVVALAGCGGATTGEPSGGAAVSGGPSPEATTPGPPATPSGGPTFSIGGPAPTGTGSQDDVTQALTTAFRYDLDMTPAQAGCVASKIAGSLTAAQKTATVAAWRQVAGGPPQPVAAPKEVLSKARASADACPAGSPTPGRVRHTPAR